MKNIPEVKLGIVAVSRDCFPMSLSEQTYQGLSGVQKGLRRYLRMSYSCGERK